MSQFRFNFLLAMIAFVITMLATCAIIDPRPGSINGNGATARATPPLLLISVDGARFDYLDFANLPNFSRLIAQGLRADSLQLIFPTKTFATHYAIATGLYADGTGVVANNMWDPDRQARFSLGDRDAVGDGYWYDGEPIWNSVQKAGKTSATWSWPGSEAQIGGMRPTEWLPYAGNTPHDERVGKVLEWLDQPYEQRPDFLSLYFSIVDDAGHRHGPDHPRVVEAMQEVDRALGVLIEGLEARELFGNMHILIVSDHGMQTIDLDRYVMLDDFLDLSQVHVSDWGPAAQIWASEDGLSAEQIYAALDDAHPHMRVWKKADIPARYHFSNHKRVPDVVAEADLGWMISNKPYYAGMQRGLLNGMHGWDPAWKAMHGMFIAHGPAFVAGSRLPATRGVDLYSLMTELLQVRAADNHGSLTAFSPILYADEAAQIRISDWACAGQLLTLREGPASAGLHHNERVFALPLHPSASGVKYKDTDTMFWSKGDQAVAELNGQTFEDCRRITQGTLATKD